MNTNIRLTKLLYLDYLLQTLVDTSLLHLLSIKFFNYSLGPKRVPYLLTMIGLYMALFGIGKGMGLLAPGRYYC